MSTLEPTTDKLIVQRGVDLFTTTVEDMSTIQDDDLVLIGRGSESYKITGKEFKEQSGGGGTTIPPSIGGIELTSTGSGFSGNTFTTNLQNYSPGIPTASQTMKARVVGPLTLVGETSPITALIQDHPTINMWKSDTLPSNLQEILDGDVGTVAEGGDNLDVNTLLIVVHQPSAVDGDEVWTANGSATFSLDNGTDLGDGHYDASGTRLGGIGGYGNTEWTQFTYGGTVDDTYKIPLVAAYSVIRIRATGTIGVPTNGPDQTTLTLTDRQDLDNGMFEPGDVVQENVESGATKEWAGFVELTQAVNPYNTGTPYLYDGGVYESTSTNLLAFDRNELGDTYSLTFTFVGGAQNFQTYTSTTAGGGWTQVLGNSSGPFTIDQDTTDYNRFVQIYGTGSGEFLYKIEGTANGKTVETVVSIDPNSPKMAVTGGTWNIGETVKNTVPHAPVITPTTDEITGFSQADSWNMAQIWRSNLTSSTGGFQSAAGNAFDGNVANRASTNSSGTDVKLTFAPSPAVSFSSKLEVYCDQGSDVPTASWDGHVVNPGGGKLVTVYEGSGTIDSTKPLVIDTADANQLATLNAVRLDGQILVDSDFGTSSPKNTVLTFATDKDLVNFKAGDDVEQDSGYTPVTSAITGVTDNTAPDYTTTGTYAYGGDT